MTKRKSKKLSERIHARRRLKQRYEIDYTVLRPQILKEVKQGKTITLEKQSIRVSLRLAKINGKIFKFVWDKERREVVTFLPIRQDERPKLESMFEKPVELLEQPEAKEVKEKPKRTDGRTFDSFRDFMVGCG